jgi:hypothetical protein
MKFSEYLFDQNRRDTLTRDHLIVAKTIKRAHRRRRASSTEVWTLIAAVAIVGFYAAGQHWTKMDVDQRFLSREVGR